MAEKTPTSKINLPDGVKKEDLALKLKHEKEVGLKYQKRRHERWIEIYELYRNIIRINRLTQRQSMNIPLMKETARTILSKIGDTPDINIDNRGGSPDSDIIANALWKQHGEDLNNFSLVDRIDKKQDILGGRSHIVLNWDPTEKRTTIKPKENSELLVDPKTDPTDIETARFTVETNIFKPLEEVLRSDAYDTEAKTELRKAYDKRRGGKSGWMNAMAYRGQIDSKNERLKSLGIRDIEELEGYDKIVPLDGHITHIWDKKLGKYVRYYVVMALDKIIMRADTLEKTMGVNFYPYEGWADDLEITDYWSDGIGDLILIPNKAINMWISQYFENRTLRSFGMNVYNSKIEGFNPQSWQPRPFGWYGVPGKPDDVFKRVDIPEIQGTLEDIQYLIGIAEKASATGAIDKGAVETAKRTLGEIEIAVGNAMKRTNDMELFYNRSRERLVRKWFAITNANTPDDKEVPLYKKTLDGKTYAKKTVKKADWMSDEGIEVEVYNKQQRMLDKTDEIVRMKAVQQEFPQNMPLKKAIQRRMVGLIDLTPTEVKEIEEFETENAMAAFTGGAAIPEAAGPMDAMKQLQGIQPRPTPMR